MLLAPSLQERFGITPLAEYLWYTCLVLQVANMLCGSILRYAQAVEYNADRGYAAADRLANSIDNATRSVVLAIADHGVQSTAALVRLGWTLKEASAAVNRHREQRVIEYPGPRMDDRRDGNKLQMAAAIAGIAAAAASLTSCTVM